MPAKTATLPVINRPDLSITIDASFYRWLSRYRWRVPSGCHPQLPRPHAFIDHQQVYLARLLLHAPEDRFARHRNGDVLDCRLENLCLVETRGEAGEPEPPAAMTLASKVAELERKIPHRWPEEMN